MKTKDFIDMINSHSDELYSLYCLEDHEYDFEMELPYFVTKLPGEVHRWYTTATLVYECDDGLVGVSGFDYGHGDDIDPEDCYEPCHAEEYEPFTVTSYRAKRNS